MSPFDAVIPALEQTGWSAVVTDASWRIVWSSAEIAKILGDDDAAVSDGRHMLETDALPAFQIVAEDSVAEWVRAQAPYALHDGTSRDELRDLVAQSCRALVDEAEPAEPPERWTLRMR